MFKIEIGVPLLKPRLRPSKYPFAEMAVGDSFFVPLPADGARRGTIATAISHYAKKNPGTKFAVRSVEGGVRVWRIA